MKPRQTFKKSERLCNKTLIEKLFNQGFSFYGYPFKLVYLAVENNKSNSGEYPAKVLFTVSKRQFKKAVQRNKLKRLMREGYRKNKHQLYDFLSTSQLQMAIAFIYTSKETLPYADIEKKIKAALLRLQQEIIKTNTHKI
ncbi:MAG: ribonuclease P protein component [Bacteroidales bacterium]|nr:ribonuclease P protein component [Bacteroidales bacterium]